LWAAIQFSFRFDCSCSTDEILLRTSQLRDQLNELLAVRHSLRNLAAQVSIAVEDKQAGDTAQSVTLQNLLTGW